MKNIFFSNTNGSRFSNTAIFIIVDTLQEIVELPGIREGFKKEDTT